MKTPRYSSNTAWYQLNTPWYYGWNIIAFCVLFQTVSFGAVFYSFAVIALPLTEAFGLSLSQVMLATVFLQIGMGVMSPLLGRTLDRVRLRNLVTLGALALGLGFFILANTHSQWVMLLVYGLLLPAGLILSGSIAAQTAAARWFVRRRGFAVGIVAIGTSFGAFLFPPLVEYLISHYGVAKTFQTLSLLSVITIIPLAWLVLHRDPNESDLQRELQSSDNQSPPITDDRDWTTAQILRHRPFWIIICGFAPVSGCFTAVQFNLGAYTQNHGLTSAHAAYLLSLLAVAMAGGKFFFASLADRVDHRLLFWLIAGSQGTVLLALQFSPTYGVLMAIVSLFGFSMGGGLPMLGAVIASQFGVKAFGRLIGISTLFITASSAAGPYLTALIYDMTGSFNAPFSLLAGLLLPGALAMILLKPFDSSANLAPLKS